MTSNTPSLGLIPEGIIVGAIENTKEKRQQPGAGIHIRQPCVIFDQKCYFVRKKVVQIIYVKNPKKRLLEKGSDHMSLFGGIRYHP